MQNSLSINRSFSALILCFIFVLPVHAVISPNTDTLTFIHVTDPHVCNLTCYHPFFVQKRNHFGKNIELFPEFFKTIPGKYKADFVVVTGDNIDYYEAEAAQGGNNCRDTRLH